ncbi:MAG: tRNA (cytidine(34)-2'-O)-methyltransferase [Firmicutes bacterium]|nr:tRNA (cytidine(34)-2'-O)-methyltransferase [Bacillota bacterium]
MHVVLVHPEIPGNTGNIARTCAATGTTLHLVRPLGFQVTDRHLRRAGLDYWHLVEVRYWDDFDALRASYPEGAFFFATGRAARIYTEVRYPPGSFLVFGRESTGLPEELLSANPEHCVRIPMARGARSLNLANAVAVILYEALRQQGFAGLS